MTIEITEGMLLENAYDEIDRLTETLQESVDIPAVFKAYDNNGWDIISGYDKDDGVKLDVVQQWSESNRQLVINPLIKRGLRIRVSYIFGAQLIIEGNKSGVKKDFIDSNASALFSPQAYQELETALGTDGSIFLLLDKKEQDITRVPISEIGGVIVRPGDKERTTYVQRVWTEAVDRYSGGKYTTTETVTKKAWYPVVGIAEKDKNKSRTKLIRGERIDDSKSMVHVTVNKQTGWIYGIPDVQAVVFWVKAYKETLEANYMLTRSLAKYAYKVVNTAPQSARRAGMTIAAPSPIDPNSGRPATSGATNVLEPGQDLVAVNKAGANVNFRAGEPLAAMVAAGMDVSLVHLLSDPSIGNQGNADVLDVPQLKSMATRQEVYKRMFATVLDYFGYSSIKVTFPPIQDLALHRIFQAYSIAATTNTLHVEELRDLFVMLLRAYGLTPKAGLPAPGAYQTFVSGINAAEEAEKNRDAAAAQSDAALAAKTAGDPAHPGSKPIKNPDPSGGKRSPSGPTHDGDHSQRKTEK